MRQQVEVHGHNPEQITKCVLALLATPNKKLNENQLAKLKTQDSYWSGNIRQAPLPDDELYNALIACCSNPKPDEDAAKIVLQRIRGYDEKHQRLCREDAFTSEFPYVSALRRKTSGEPSQTPYQIAVASGSEVMKTLLEAELGPNDLGLPIPEAEKTPAQLRESLTGTRFNPEKLEDRHLLFLIATNQHPVFEKLGQDQKSEYTKACLKKWLPEELVDFKHRVGPKEQSFYEWLAYDYPNTSAAEMLLTQKKLIELFKALCANILDKHRKFNDYKTEFNCLINLIKAGLGLKSVINFFGKYIEYYRYKGDFDYYLLSLRQNLRTCVTKIQWFDGANLRERSWLPTNLESFAPSDLYLLRHSDLETTASFFGKAEYLEQVARTTNSRRDPRIAELYALLAEEPMYILHPPHLEIFKEWIAKVTPAPEAGIAQLRQNIEKIPLRDFLNFHSPNRMRLLKPLAPSSAAATEMARLEPSPLKSLESVPLRLLESVLQTIQWFDAKTLKAAGWLPPELAAHLSEYSSEDENAARNATQEFAGQKIRVDDPRRDPRISAMYALLAKNPEHILERRNLEIFEQWCNLVHVPGSSIDDLKQSIDQCTLTTYREMIRSAESPAPSSSSDASLFSQPQASTALAKARREAAAAASSAAPSP